MDITTIIITATFICAIILILTESLNRAVVTLSGALIVYFTLTFIEGYTFGKFVGLLFGTDADGFVNLHSLMLILGMMFIVEVSESAGVFQFLAVIAIKMSKGRPIPLLTIFCFLSIIFAALLNNILTVMILIPITITVSRILQCDPTPYILTQAVLVNVGGTIFSISSIPNILIVTAAQSIDFTSYFLTMGLFSIFVFVCTILFFIWLYKDDLKIPRDETIDSLEEFEVWNVVANRYFLIEAVTAFFVLIAAFFLIPADVIPPDIIALSIAMVLTILSSFHGINAQKIIKKFDLELLLYLLGVFVIAGGLEEVGVIALIGKLMRNVGGGELVQILLILWFSAVSSSLIDNIPITKVLIPIIDNISAGSVNRSVYFYSLSIGANWGDNLTPLGDNILVLNLAKQHHRPISMTRFWKLGLITTVYQLYIATIYFSFWVDIIMGLMLTSLTACLVMVGCFFRYFAPKPIRTKIELRIQTFRKLIIR